MENPYIDEKRIWAFTSGSTCYNESGSDGSSGCGGETSSDACGGEG